MHRLDATIPAQPASLPSRASPAPDRADAETLHRTYSALLIQLRLSDAHREALRQRGLSADEIDRRGYRTLPVQGRAPLARKLREQFGDDLMAVPGFIIKEGDSGRPYVTLAGAAGILIPVRDLAGRIVALLARRDNASDGRGKYHYISSAAAGGPGPGAPAHIPLGLTGPVEVVRITEGALKADVAHALSGVSTIGLPGVSTWRSAVPMLRELGARTACLAFDADVTDKPTVARPLAALAEALAAEGFAVEMERWPPERKGIDDALAAGVTIEVLAGDAARQAVADALTEATAGEPIPEPGPLGRLGDVLAAGGAEALFRDGELLRALAQLAEENAAEFMCIRARLRGGAVRLREFDKVLAPLRQEIRRERPALNAAGCYRVSAGRIVRDVLTKDDPVEVALANWSGRIVEETVHDDGTERRITFAVEGALADGAPLPRAEISADKFAFMRWPAEAWGTRAVVLAGASTADHLRVALQLLSGDVRRRTVYGHTGWREIAGKWVYLHAGGAIGAAGAVEGVDVALPDALAGYLLPSPPKEAELIAAVRSSLSILNGLAADRIVFPVLAVAYRAALGSTDFSVHLAGPTGVFKTELAALAQQHYGAGMDARHLPGSWLSTGNALEAVAHAAKDALLTVDDFAPHGTAGDVARVHREADRLLRAQGNRSGRGRMRADSSLRPNKPPRGLVLSTGEDVPRGQSLRARLLVVEIGPGDVDMATLTTCQRAAASGKQSEAMAGFLRWLATRYGTVSTDLARQRAELRDKSLADGRHARTPGIVADLALGLHYFLDFALEIGASNTNERAALAHRGWQALEEAAEEHASHLAVAEPCGQFLRLVAGALASGRAHVAAPDGGEPDAPEAWGWRSATVGTGMNERPKWQPNGRRIGWTELDSLYLEPEAAFAEAQRLAVEQGESLSVGPRTLWRRLREKGLLAGWDHSRQRNTVRRSLEGVQHREVVHLRSDALATHGRPSTPSIEGAAPREPQQKVDGNVDGVVDVRAPEMAEPSTLTVQFSAGESCSGQCGRSNTTEEDRVQQKSRIESPHGARRFYQDEGGRPCGPAKARSWTWEGAPQWFDVAEYPPP